mmetsp:Transcript_13169/g.43203  ORF Transcript_13169/g.43203 Transcript_13169/m.43203 type:complete len:234 (+) Transcript_13169:1824-2525(+)
MRWNPPAGASADASIWLARATSASSAGGADPTSATTGITEPPDSESSASACSGEASGLETSGAISARASASWKLPTVSKRAVDSALRAASNLEAALSDPRASSGSFAGGSCATAAAWTTSSALPVKWAASRSSRSCRFPSSASPSSRSSARNSGTRSRVTRRTAASAVSLVPSSVPSVSSVDSVAISSGGSATRSSSIGASSASSSAESSSTVCAQAPTTTAAWIWRGAPFSE